MKLSPSILSGHIQDAFTWLLPVSLIVFTFLILFFGISEQVGNIKVFNVNLSNQVQELETQIADLKGNNVPVAAEVNKPGKPTVVKESNRFRNVEASKQKINLNGKTYWMFKLISDKSVNEDSRSVMVLGDACYYMYTTLSDSKSEANFFDMVEFNSTEQKSVKSPTGPECKNLVVFLDDKMVFYNDFDSNDSSKLKEVLGRVAGSPKPSDNLLKAANEALK